MKVKLAHRHYGIHEPVKNAEIPGEFSDYAEHQPGGEAGTYIINEDALLSSLPEGFLPVPARRVLLLVTEPWGASAQVGLSKFRNWAKYFDAYALSLVRPGTEDEAEHDETCCMNGIPPTAGPHPDCPGKAG